MAIEKLEQLHKAVEQSVRIAYTYEKVQYKLFLFGKILFKLPDFCGQWFHDHNIAIREFIDYKIMSVSSEN